MNSTNRFHTICMFSFHCVILFPCVAVRCDITCWLLNACTVGNSYNESIARAGCFMRLKYISVTLSRCSWENLIWSVVFWKRKSDALLWAGLWLMRKKLTFWPESLIEIPHFWKTSFKSNFDFQTKQNKKQTKKIKKKQNHNLLCNLHIFAFESIIFLISKLVMHLLISQNVCDLKQFLYIYSINYSNVQCSSSIQVFT